MNDDSSVVSKWYSSLIDDTRLVNYDRNMFIVQATEMHLAFPANFSQC